MTMTHNPFRKRTCYDKICLWVERNGRPMRFYCTRFFRTSDGALGLERVTGTSKIATTSKSAIIDPVIMEQAI